MIESHCDLLLGGLDDSHFRQPVLGYIIAKLPKVGHAHRWFTVGAQAINFIILVWLLKRFLYKPILNGVDRGRKRVAAELRRGERPTG